MTSHRIGRRIAAVLVSHAERMLPAEQAEWGRAMAAEVEHIANDFEAVRWALGCALASYLAGVNSMMRSRFDVARWLLGFEILVCLGPLTLLWIMALYAVLLADAQTASVVVPTIVGTLGPISLLLGLRVVVLCRSVAPASFAILAVSFIVIAALQVVRPGATWFAFDWRVLMLNSILPGIVCGHLALIGSGKTTGVQLQAIA
jgi:hypothetical protein